MSDMPFSIVTLSLYVLSAIVVHLFMSFAQTIMHYKLGHHPIGGKFFRNHIQFHHANYAKGHLTSSTYLNDKGNNAPYFLIPICLSGLMVYALMPTDFFFVVVAAVAASFYAHVLFDKHYHVTDSWLQRFAWFRRKQELHFVHHLHANTNFGVMHFFWDRLLGTYRGVDH
jgi:sterol desaturase/sphingolipid hydroxylase (fatty acid hydroxylase superfamily)